MSEKKKKETEATCEIPKSEAPPKKDTDRKNKEDEYLDGWKRAKRIT